MAKEEKQVAVVEQKTTAVASYDYGDVGAEGFEDIGSKDLSIPFINLLQAKSPDVEDAPEGSSIRAGMLKNTVTGEFISAADGVPFIPVHKEHVVVEWVPRLDGGGFVAVHQLDSDVVVDIMKKNGGTLVPPKGSDGKRAPLKNGKNDMIETYNLYVKTLNKEGTETTGFAIISFTSTKIKPYKNFITAVYMLGKNIPLYASRGVLKSTKQVNNNQTSFNFEIKPLRSTWKESLINPQTEAELLEEAKGFRQMILDGMAKADFASQRNDETLDPEASERPERTVVQGDEEIPF